jgi:hypothetical protein
MNTEQMMRQGYKPINYKWFDMYLEIKTSWEWVEKIETTLFVATNWLHKFVKEYTKPFPEMEKLMKKKINNFLKTK